MHVTQTLMAIIVISLALITWRVGAAEENSKYYTSKSITAHFKRNEVNEFHEEALLARAAKESILEYERKRDKNKRTKRAAKTVCYGELGCFEDTGPFSYLEVLPAPPEEIKTKFYFYSTRNRSDRPLMELPFVNMTSAFMKLPTYQSSDINDTVKNVQAPNAEITTEGVFGIKRRALRTAPVTLADINGFDELSVRIIVHGFGSACPHVWIYEIKTALMAVEDCIVICVDWENGATFPNYVRAAANTRLVGKQLAMLVKLLEQHKGLNITRTHLIGFSLGAHVAGFAGAELPGLSRITGLDPAGPLFESQHPKVRLDSSDAVFVDVVHSNGENLVFGGLGSWQPMGHVDFYPNGGRVQKGCSNLFIGAITDFIWTGQPTFDEEGRSLCNHRRAYKFFIDSVAPRCMFPAFPCDTYENFLKGKCFPCAQDLKESAEEMARCGNMGYYADRSSGRGQLYLLTREEEPFCAHQFQLQIYNSFSDLPLRTIGRLEAILEGEGGFNETFQISDKDDAEFFAGDIISKIVVPHPALGFPTIVNLLYKSYSGWLSKGLPHWDIDKVVLTDSFGRSHSTCKPATKLTSGTAVRLVLLPGDCELEDEEEYGTNATSTNITTTTSATEIDFTTQPGGETIDLNVQESVDDFVVNQSDKLQGTTFQGNALDRDEEIEMSRSLFDVEEEVQEPILRNKGLTLEDVSVLQSANNVKEIMEPILKSKSRNLHKESRANRANEVLKSISEAVESNLTNESKLEVHSKTQLTIAYDNEAAILPNLTIFAQFEFLQENATKMTTTTVSNTTARIDAAATTTTEKPFIMQFFPFDFGSIRYPDCANKVQQQNILEQIFCYLNPSVAKKNETQLLTVNATKIRSL